MPVTVVAGGQYGSEGKGKIAHFLAIEQRAQIAVRVGGSNSGHTVVDDHDKSHIFRQLPTAAIVPDITCIIAAGTYIDVDVLLAEISRHKLPKSRILIDPLAYVISDSHRKAERSNNLRERIGSTLSGTGAALVERVSRINNNGLAKNEPRLAPFLANTRSILRRELDAGTRVILEGTQGYGLSVLHSPHYPKVTSRDTTAAAFVSEAGLSPLDVDDIVLVIRTFPIRVAGNSGPLENEITWAELTHESGAPFPLIERTSVTGNERRIANFDPAIVGEAIKSNAPTKIALNHLDYCDYDCRRLGKITQKADLFLSRLEKSIRRRVDFVGFSPKAVAARHDPELRKKVA